MMLRRAFAIVTTLASIFAATKAYSNEPGAIACQYRGGWEDAATFADEGVCLDRLGGMIGRIGDMISVRLTDGTEKLLTFNQDNADPDSGNFVRARFANYWPSRNLVFFAKTFGGHPDGYRAVDLKTGGETSFDELPVFSPSGRRAVSIAQQGSGLVTTHSFSVLGISIDQQFQCSLVGCRPGVPMTPRWVGEDRIVFYAQPAETGRSAQASGGVAVFDGTAWKTTPKVDR